MKTEISRKEYRKKIESLGFKVSFKNVSFQDLARQNKVFAIIKDSNGKEMPSLFTGENLKHWEPVLRVLSEFKPI